MIFTVADVRKITYKFAFMKCLKMTHCVMFKKEVQSRIKSSFLHASISTAKTLQITLVPVFIYLWESAVQCKKETKWETSSEFHKLVVDTEFLHYPTAKTFTVVSENLITYISFSEMSTLVRCATKRACLLRYQSVLTSDVNGTSRPLTASRS
jgi:hypothetical protein